MANVLRNFYSKFFSLNVPKTLISPAVNLIENRQCWKNSGVCIRRVHLTRNICGIEEFFPARVLECDEPMPEEIPSGRSWRAGELRQKSNEDLHKLWYVLLKERNMLMTVQWEAKRQEVLMPSPERLHKVKKSMAMIKVVIGERQKSIEDIERHAKEKQLDPNLISMDSEEHKEIIEDPQELNEQSRQVPLAT